MEPQNNKKETTPAFEGLPDAKPTPDPSLEASLDSSREGLADDSSASGNQEVADNTTLSKPSLAVAQKAVAQKDPASPSTHPKPVISRPAATKPPLDPSISIDNGSAPVGVAAIIIDALAAAAAIAFAVLILRETLPFLK